MDIGTRLKELRKKHKFSQSYIAQELFISQAAYSLIENAQNGIVAGYIIKLGRIYDVTADYILTGDRLVIKVGPGKGFVPLIKVEAQAEFLKNQKNSLKDVDSEWYRIPGYKPGIDGKLFEIEGKNIILTMLPGEIVLCQAQKGIATPIDGCLVLIVTDNHVFVKRLRLDPDPGYYSLEDDNPHKDALHKIKKKDINELMMIRGKISIFGPYAVDESSEVKTVTASSL